LLAVGRDGVPRMCIRATIAAVQWALAGALLIVMLGCRPPPPRIFGKVNAASVQTDTARDLDAVVKSAGARERPEADPSTSASASPAEPQVESASVAERPNVNCSVVVEPQPLRPQVKEGAQLYRLPPALIWSVIEVASSFDGKQRKGDSYGLSGLSRALLQSHGVTDPSTLD
jgi:hypothetical protein